MDTVICVLFWVFALVVVATLVFGLGIWCVSCLMGSARLRNVSRCMLSWVMLFPLFPRVARKAGFFKKHGIRWTVALLSPTLLLLLCFLVGMVCDYYQEDQLCANKRLLVELGFVNGVEGLGEPYRMVTHEEVVALTEMANFPEFSYLEGSWLGGSGYGEWVFLFRDSVESVQWFEQLAHKVQAGDNLYWAEQPDGSYVFERRRYSLHIKRRGFMMSEHQIYGTTWLRHYADADSLLALTGVRFPKYHIVSYRDVEGVPLWTTCVNIKLDSVPSEDFIASIEESGLWEKRGDGKYEFYTLIPHCFGTICADEWHRICVSTDSRLVTVECRVP